MCRVTLGKSFLQFSTMKMAHAPPGHHSVIGRPSAGGLSYPEYVIYRGEQVCSCCVILDIIPISSCKFLSNNGEFVLYSNVLVLVKYSYHSHHLKLKL